MTTYFLLFLSYSSTISHSTTCDQDP